MEGSGASAAGARSVTPEPRPRRDAAYWSGVLAEERRAAREAARAQLLQQDIHIHAIGAVLANAFDVAVAAEGNQT